MNELITFLSAMLPLTELRGAIPFGYAVLDMPLWTAFGFALLGNALVSLLILHLLDPVSTFLRKHSTHMNRLFAWIFKRTRTKHSHRISELGYLGLILFVAVPLPGSGGWTGALVAYLFGINKKLAGLLIVVGLSIAGIIVSLTTAGVSSLV